MSAPPTSVLVANDQARISLKGSEPLELALHYLPENLVEWFVTGRKEGFKSLSRGNGPGRLFSRHLPVIATTGKDTPHQVRLAHKGVGFFPREELLDNVVAEYDRLLTKTQDLAPSESLTERLQSISALYDKPEDLDTRLLGSLEIFAGGTFENLVQRPLASLLFTDPGPPYTSFQLDCAVQIVEPPDSRFRFLQLARGLFERDPFHIQQPGVRCAYLFWITGVTDKTPRPVTDGMARHRL